ncbi:MAG TPA: ABC transporter substrate binding protein, partial [Desulfuromonadaceae bacterium]
KVVIALGREALAEALRLPPSIPVIYDMVVTPPAANRPNTAGFYMATPAREYVDLINTHLQSIRKIAVIGSREQLNILAADATQQAVAYNVRNPFELVNTLRQIESANAILLLPDATLLTTTAMEEVYLLSFRRGIPVFGISERQVKEGALLALVVDTVQVGRQIGEYAARAIKGGSFGQAPPTPPRRFDLYVNTDTARKMGIRLSDEMLRVAKRTYP